MIKGNCLCGQIKYEYDADVTEMAVCHCNQCKLAQGTPFATNIVLKRQHFRFISGENLTKSYASSPNKRRVFCSNCGSPIYSMRTDLPDILRVRAGSVVEGTLPKPSYQIYCESASDWFDLNDAAKYERKP